MNVILVGYGRMGKLCHQSLNEFDDVSIAGIVHPGMFESPMDVPGKIDAIVDFSYPGNLEAILEYACTTGCALVLGTTGYSEKQLQRVREVSAQVPVVQSSNFSTGIAVLKLAISAVKRALPDGFDVEIVETHHNKKADAPSGTAKLLLGALDPEGEYNHVYGREGIIGPRGHEIGIHAIRGGTVAGEHSVRFFGQDEIIELRHSATSPQIFVNGAMLALRYAIGHASGLYSLEDVLEGRGDK